MKSKKDEKETRKKRQKKEENPKSDAEKYLSPAPKKPINEAEAAILNLQDLSPDLHKYRSCNTPIRNQFSNELAMIETPANTCPRMLYEQIDEAHQPIISGIINWEGSNDENSESYEDSELLGISEEECQMSDSPENQVQKPSSVSFATPNQKLKESKEKKEGFKKIEQAESTTDSKKITCNCKRTKCLKLYCDCFRINQTCEGCNCIDCHNLTEFEEERNNSMLSLMDRNPEAFKPKIEEERHAKGCHCKKSNCLKKYCECFQAGLKCGLNCQCEDCKNGNCGTKNELNGNGFGVVEIEQMKKEKSLES